MSFEPDVLQGFVQRYLDTAARGNADDVAALYAEDATLEDPVGGGEVHIGRQAIAGFYKVMEGAEVTTELLSFRAGGHEAAFMFAITVGGAMRIEPIEVMTFDGDGMITSMKAYWGPQNVTQL
ncbi:MULTISPECIES: nuclear transport factor 2 family protein [Mycobacteriaceae]|uniref:Nuclear transport factor 2 family protein n=1 Tax=Mycolicibacterium parafortuitum TaxID=39692 RepID=A0ACC6MP97_MYCPF|nr:MULTISPECIES: nuclear transport factor 2 family protein [Mycobacteriaceae]MBX7450205.1 nuclear transport factor 2 family protein [Mycolicibacterium aurantiacum]QFS93232.1 Steroid Delta-isomerase [Mycobacterium sp. THAF192]MDZ5088672.1 nuclear transport factor 2 family protein [Mycolicibacterium parafortuitum]GFM21445.1 nuclear transport factor 2 [Mycobacterium sp. PO1]GFM25020.1 nuclear transport factor 2 [Mycobacterium sp. PO2]